MIAEPESAESLPAGEPPADATSGRAGAQDTCWTLIDRAANGDRSARSEFGRAYDRLIRSYLAKRWRDTPLAGEVDDAAQEVFFECMKEGGPLERVDRERGFRAYLLGLVRNIALRAERSAARRHERPAGGDSAFVDIAAREPQLSAFFDHQWAMTMVQAARRMFEADGAADPSTRLHAQLFDLRFSQGLPIRTIAERWQMDADALHRAYAKARERFRASLRKVVAYHAVLAEDDLDAECRRVLAALGNRPAD